MWIICFVRITNVRVSSIGLGYLHNQVQLKKLRYGNENHLSGHRDSISDRVIAEADTILGKSWGLKPKILKLLYETIVPPMFAYLVWYNR